MPNPQDWRSLVVTREDSLVDLVDPDEVVILEKEGADIATVISPRRVGVPLLYGKEKVGGSRPPQRSGKAPSCGLAVPRAS
jgi:hypothetical protein